MTKDQTQSKITPLSGYIIVEPVDAQSQTKSGLYLPETAQEKPSIGKVVAVGSDLILENGKALSCPVSVGELVVYKSWSGEDVKFEGENIKLVKFDGLIAKINK
jgi:chaperonin GroES